MKKSVLKRIIVGHSISDSSYLLLWFGGIFLIISLLLLVLEVW